MKFKLRLCAAALSLLACLSAASCDRPAQPADTTAESKSHSETTAPIESTAETTSEPTQKNILDVRWNLGYVGSDQNMDGYNYMINPDGIGYSYSDVITLEKAGTKITFTDPGNGRTDNSVFVISTWREISGWMIHMKGISIRGNDERVMNLTTEGTTYTYISSEDNECIRLCYASGQQSADATVEHPPVYFEYTGEPGTGTGVFSEEDLLNLWLDADKERAFFEILDGITFTVIGDSYLDRASIKSGNNWPTLLAKKYGMTYKNYGIGGSTISNFVTDHNPMVDRYTVMAMNNPDVIIVEGGRNDYNFNIPLGSLEDTSTKTMMGATRHLLQKLRERYPNAVIIGLTCWETGGNQNKQGHYCREYGQAMLDVCADLGIPCINALDQRATGVYMTDPNFRAKYCRDENDVSHLNDDGMRLVLPFFEQSIAQIYQEYQKK